MGSLWYCQLFKVVNSCFVQLVTKLIAHTELLGNPGTGIVETIQVVLAATARHDQARVRDQKLNGDSDVDNAAFGPFFAFLGNENPVPRLDNDQATAVSVRLPQSPHSILSSVERTARSHACAAPALRPVVSASSRSFLVTKAAMYGRTTRCATKSAATGSRWLNTKAVGEISSKSFTGNRRVSPPRRSLDKVSKHQNELELQIERNRK